MHVLEILAPVFLVIALGAVLRWRGLIPPGFSRQANRLVFWVALPAMLFHKLTTPGPKALWAWEMFAAMTVGTLGAVGVAYLVAGLARLPRTSVGAFVQVAFRGNLAYIGLPIIVLAYGESPGGVATAALVAMGPLVVVYNVAAILVLASGSGAPGVTGPGALSRHVATNPLIIAIVLGIGWSTLGLPVPVVAARTLGLVGAIALPLALFGVGASLVETQARGRLRPSFFAAFVKLIATPAIGWGAGRLLGLPREHLMATIIFLATPTAVAGYVLAEQMGGDTGLTGSAVVTCTILSAPVLAVVLLLV